MTITLDTVVLDPAKPWLYVDWVTEIVVAEKTYNSGLFNIKEDGHDCEEATDVCYDWHSDTWEEFRRFQRKFLNEFKTKWDPTIRF